MKVIVILPIAILATPNAFSGALVGELGARVGRRQYESKLEQGDYLFRPSISAGLSWKFGQDNLVKPEIGLFYRTIKDVREFSLQLENQDGTIITRSGEQGMKQHLLSAPISMSFSRPNWFVVPFFGIEPTFVQSTKFVYSFSDYDSTGRKDGGNEGVSDATWFHKRFNLYFSPGFEIPFQRSFNRFSIKSSLDLSVFDAPKADTVLKKLSENSSIRVVIPNRYRIHAISTSIRYSIF